MPEDGFPIELPNLCREVTTNQRDKTVFRLMHQEPQKEQKWHKTLSFLLLLAFFALFGVASIEPAKLYGQSEIGGLTVKTGEHLEDFASQYHWPLAEDVRNNYLVGSDG
jgi:hypothetical protein